ncbi:unnamed protein product [Urochloa decumbens]|uniref:Uncharacterized protein n=1 Tax=Urochloa decumbens TaxID=240449 RepID=A0ABC9EEM9_9POAL
MAAAAPQPPPAPPRAAEGGGFFAFLKDGVVVATRNSSLFLPLAALHAARSTAYFATKTLAFRSFAAAVDLDAYYEDGAVDGTLFFGLLIKFLAGRWRLLLPAGVAYIAAHVTLGLAIDAAIAAAAAAAIGQNMTFASFMGTKVKPGNLVGPMATAAFGGIVEWASVGVGMLAMPGVFFGTDVAVLVCLLFQFIAFLFTFFYVGAVRDVAVVASVAEPGLRGAGAVGRARRLMRGGRRLAQAALYSLVAWALHRAVWRMHAAAVARLPRSGLLGTAVPFSLDAVVVYLLVGALKVLCAATITAYYFDCRRTEGDKAGHRE